MSIRDYAKYKPQIAKLRQNNVKLTKQIASRIGKACKKLRTTADKLEQASKSIEEIDGKMADLYQQFTAIADEIIDLQAQKKKAKKDDDAIQLDTQIHALDAKVKGLVSQQNKAAGVMQKRCDGAMPKIEAAEAL
ncbi:MAG: hypothetical protein AAGC57_20150 [Pseudomonadota bacterium]